MTDLSHLHAIEQRLVHETARLNASKTEGKRVMRQCWVNGIQKELVAERKFLGLPEETLDEILMSDDELLAELGV